MQINKSAHSTHILHYHLIWCVKYRKSILTHDIGDRLKIICQEIADEQNAIIEAIETDVTHVHIMLNLKPTHSIPNLVKLFKGRSSRLLFEEFPHLKKRLWGGHLWSPSYFITTAGGAPLETLKSYVENQRTK